MKIPFLDLSKIPNEIQLKLQEKFAELLKRGVYSFGQEVESFESEVKEFLNTSHAISCANGTDALELALRALNIGSGDEVILPAMTWVSTAEAVIMVGAKPVFWDTDENGLLAKDWTKAVTSKTKAVIPVHLYGQMLEMNNLMVKAKHHHLKVIEDAAQAFGSFYDGSFAGTWGDVGCLSFYPTKNLGALGEAGMCLCQDAGLAERIRLISNHGQPERDQHNLVGRNSRIDTLQAAFLRIFLEDIFKHQQVRKEFAGIYCEELSGLPDLELPINSQDPSSNMHLFVIKSPRRDSLKQYLEEHGVGTAIHYPTILPDMVPYEQQGNYMNARKLSKECLSLPLNPWMKKEEVYRVCKLIKDFFK